MAEPGFLISEYEDVRFEGGGENPALAEIKANRHTDRRGQVVGITPVTRRVGRTAAPQVVIEIAIAETEVGRQRDAAPRGKGHAGDASRLGDQVGNGILGARALVFEGAVGPPAIEPEKHAARTREREGADKAHPPAGKLREARFFARM